MLSPSAGTIKNSYSSNGRSIRTIHGSTKSTTKFRARQNVVFELGFFIGLFGPARVAALVKGDIEPPSDFDGVVYIDLDDAGGWKPKLGRELQAAGFDIDWNKVMR